MLPLFEPTELLLNVVVVTLDRTSTPRQRDVFLFLPESGVDIVTQIIFIGQADRHAGTPGAIAVERRVEEALSRFTNPLARCVKRVE